MIEHHDNLVNQINLSSDKKVKMLFSRHSETSLSGIINNGDIDMMTTEEILEATEQLTDAQRELLINLLQKQRIETIQEQIPKSKHPRQPGVLAGHLIIADDFDAPLPDEIITAFRGEVL